MNLRNSLSERSQPLSSRLQVIEAKARQIVEFSQAGAHLSFTTHGFSHISAVEENYDWLLSAADVADFNPPELFCLLCATFFHDALMIPRQLGDEATARRDHAKRAHDFLMEQHELLTLSIHEATAIGQVIAGHATNDITEIQSEIALGSVLLDLRKLGACLSLADICHADASRAPDIVFRHLALDEDSAFHWRRHLQISGITRKGDRILMSALYFSDDGENAVVAYKEQIEQQLSIVSPYFRSRLSALTGVDLQAQRLKSRLDVPMRFQTNTPAILDILIEGVYQRSDVFLRELVQNSLDACHLRLARAFKRSEHYAPRIVICLLKKKGAIRGVRIDDNGIGMDVGDVQDTVLWIGNSISKRGDVRSLLDETTKKNLIATFGIGLLSCFKCADEVVVRSKKEGGDPLEFRAASISDEIRPSAALDDEIGSTFIVRLRTDAAKELNLEAAATHYFRMVQQASLEMMELEWGPQAEGYTRHDILRIAKSEAKPISVQKVSERASLRTREIKAEDFVAWLSVTKPDSADTENSANVETSEGKITILNEGVFVCDDDSGHWLPPHLYSCSGIINFSAKSVDLPVSRDKVIDNRKSAQKRADLAARSLTLVDDLVALTSSDDEAEADRAALTLAHIFSKATDEFRPRIVRQLDGFCVRPWKRERNVKLSDIRRDRPAVVNVEYSVGRFVTELQKFDGKQLYHKEDDLIQLQAAVLTQDEELVISASRVDIKEDQIVEFDLIREYFKMHGIEVVNLAGTNKISGRFRSKPLPRLVRGEFSSQVKFIEIPGLPNKRGWRLEDETWINVSNPQMAKVYDMLQSEQNVTWRVALAGAIVDMYAYRFDESVKDLLNVLFAESGTDL
jgi:hypothetical protein